MSSPPALATHSPPARSITPPSTPPSPTQDHLHPVTDFAIDAPTISETLDDIFLSSASPSQLPVHENLPAADSAPSEKHNILRGDEVSDVPRLRVTHTTAGYRAGISASKEQYIQQGFDLGYDVGGRFGLRAGVILGLLRGLVAAAATAFDTEVPRGRHVAVAAGDVRTGETGTVRGSKAHIEVAFDEDRGHRLRDSDVGEREEVETQQRTPESTVSKNQARRRRRLLDLLTEARAELCAARIFSTEYWNHESSGMQHQQTTYEIRALDDCAPLILEKRRDAAESTSTGQDGEQDLSEALISSHPLIEKWTAIVSSEMRKVGLEGLLSSATLNLPSTSRTEETNSAGSSMIGKTTAKG